MFQLPLQPYLVYKAYRRPVPVEHLGHLVSWPAVLERSLPEAAWRVRAAAAWPCSVVENRGEAAGLLMPRAPRRFALRHRDGNSRLASLSYLTSDPAHRAAAYGLMLPAPASAERIALVYALARLLAAFESACPAVGHGDLSTKNVLWSLQRGPEVFVIDCDNSERFAPDGSSLGYPGRRRAMTPNWDDPAVAKGTNPTAASDRYSLALIFLRVADAANFPIQARQRSGGAVSVDFSIPAGSRARALLDRSHPLWDLCARGLSVTDPAARPPASAWVAVLEEVLAAMGAADVAAAVRTSQGGGPAASGAPGATAVAFPEAGAPGDVEIRPVLVARRHDRRGRKPAAPMLPPRHEPVRGGGMHWVPNQPVPRPAAHAQPAGTQGTVMPSQRAWPEIKVGMRRAALWWVAIHRRAISAFLTAGRRYEGFKSLVFCGIVDAGVAIVGLFIAAMVVSPVIGI